jgi:hypothetical protein
LDRFWPGGDTLSSPESVYVIRKVVLLEATDQNLKALIVPVLAFFQRLAEAGELVGLVTPADAQQ